MLDALYDMRFDTCTPVQEKCIPEIASFLFISYEAVIASGTFGATRTFNDWKKIDDYWNSATSGLSLASLQMAAAQSGMQVASASATLQSRDYLEQYARTWGQPRQRMMLFSLNSPSGLQNIQTNANPHILSTAQR